MSKEINIEDLKKQYEEYMKLSDEEVDNLSNAEHKKYYDAVTTYEHLVEIEEAQREAKEKLCPMTFSSGRAPQKCGGNNCAWCADEYGNCAILVLAHMKRN